MAVSLVDDWEGNAEVASQCHGGDEEAAAVQRGEEKEVVDRAESQWKRPVLEKSLQSLDRQPGHECQVGQAQVEGVDHVGCGAALAGLAGVHEEHQQVGRKAQQEGEGVDKESDAVFERHLHLFSLRRRER